MDKKELLDVINNLTDGVNPLTGEVFDKAILTEDYDVAMAITHLALRTQPQLRVNKRKWQWPDINPIADEIFQRLKEWRYSVALEEDLPAYRVFTDEELMNISKATIRWKEDLLLVKGIASRRYEWYGDELFRIISEVEDEYK